MGKKVALALSSGGARGLVHIGVIDELLSRNYEIVSIAGSSMGALVGGMYAAGTLGNYEKWAVQLNRMDVLGLVDFTLGTNGFIKGEKIFEEMQRKGFIPDKSIEELNIPLTVLATDIINNNEVVFQSGKLADALRASVSIPSVFTPIKTKNGLLVDGGVLNPLPLSHLKTDGVDLVIAVDTNAIMPYKKPKLAEPIHKESDEDKSAFEQLKEKWFEFFEGDEKKKLDKHDKLGYIDMLYLVIQVMMSDMTMRAVEANPPDVFIQTSKDACGIFEFYRAKEIIDYGRQTCSKALDKANL